MTYKSKRHMVFYLVGFLDLLAVSLIVPAFPVHIKSFGVSATLTGAITSIYGAIQLFSSPLIGKWSDKSGRLTVISVCILISSLGYLLSGFYTTSLLALSLLRILPGIFKHTQDLCRCCLIEESGGDRNQALGAFNALASVGFIIGPTIHGHLIQRFGIDRGFSISYAICGSIFLLNFSVISLLRLNSNFAMKKPESSENLSNIEEKGVVAPQNGSAKLVEKTSMSTSLRKFQRGVFASRFFLALAVMMFRSSFVLWLTYYHPDLPSTTVGYILSYNGFLGLFFGFLVGSVSNLKFYQAREEKLQLHASYLVIITFLILFLSTRISVILVAMATLTMGTAVLRVCGLVLTVKYLDGCDIGHVQGLGTSVLSVARFAAPLVSGVLQETSFSAPNAVSLFLSSIGMTVFYFDSYLFVQKKGKKK